MEEYEVFFELPGIGELAVEHLFYELDGEPILFVCKDGKGTRYLCSCYQMGKNWVIGQVKEQALVDLIDNRATIRRVFKEHCSMRWTVEWDRKKFLYETGAPEEVFPRKGAYLDLPDEQNGTYRAALDEKAQASSVQITETYCGIVEVAERPVSEWRSALDGDEAVSVALPQVSRVDMPEKTPKNICKKLVGSFSAAA